MPMKAQGTIEYLVILAVVVIVALVVVSLMISSTTPSQGISSTTAQIASASNPIAIQESIVNEDGNYFLKFSNNTGENLTITEIEIGDQNFSGLDKMVPTSSETAFIINTEDVCVDGQLVVDEVVVVYTNQYDIEKRQTYSVPIQFECETYEATVGYTDEEGTSYDEEGTPLGVFCGDNTIEGPEVCDGTALTGETCLTQGYHAGTLACNGTCTGYDVSGCSYAITLSSTDSNTFIESESMIATVTNFDDTNTYHYSWYKDGDLNATTMLDTNLVSYWPFDNDVLDYYGSNDGTNNGPATQTTGKVGGAYDFDGSGDYINVGADLRTLWEIKKYNNVKPADQDTSTSSTDGRLGQGSSGRMDYYYIFTADVLYDVDESNPDYRYKMYYTGGSSSNGATRRIALATSPDGLAWAKMDNTIESPSDTTGTNGRIPFGTTTSKGDGAPIYGITDASVIIDNGTYKMWYSAYNSVLDIAGIYHATSPDGLTWTKVNNEVESPSDTTGTEGRLPLGMSGSGDDAYTWTVSVMKDNGTYKMWYSASDGSNYRIYYATSPDGLTWTKVNNAVESASDTTGTEGRLPLGTSGKGDDAHIQGVEVIKEEGIYKMFYSAYDGSNYRGYLAISDDGLTWKKVDNSIPSNSNSLSTKGRIPLGSSGGDTSRIQDISIIHVGNEYKIYYMGQVGAYTGEIYYATAPDNSLSYWAKPDSSSWEHIVNSQGGTYVNGNVDVPSTYPSYATDTALQMGKTSSSSYFDGIIDEVMIFNRALDSVEIQQLYLGGLYDGNKMGSTQLASGEDWKVGFRESDGSGWTNDFNSEEETIASFSCGDHNTNDDRDFQSYRTISLASNCWFRDNINIGTMLPNSATTPTEDTIIEKWCYNDNTANCDANGGLYAWKEAMNYDIVEGTQGICPSGWHFSTDPEWAALEQAYATGSCSATRTNSFDCAPAGEDLSVLGTSGFDIPYSGYRNSYSSTYNSIGESNYQWHSTPYSASYGYYRYFSSTDDGIYRHRNNPEMMSFSVRCVRD